MSRPGVTITIGSHGRQVVRTSATLTSAEMYSDHVAGVGSRKRSIRDRLGGSAPDNTFASGRPAFIKRQRQDEGKWKHDLFEGGGEDELQETNGRLNANDLRYKLGPRPNAVSKVGTGQVGQTKPAAREKDLREKLSKGVQPQVVQGERRLQSVVRASVSPATAVTQQVAVRKTTTQQLVEEQTVASLLQSLGLSKYLSTFQSEEVDMTALRHMSDNDLKELGVPMGPRRKILIATGAH